MKKFPLIFLLCISFLCVLISAFIFKADVFFRTPAINASWQSLTNLPYTLSHNVTVGSDSVSGSILIMGGIANDSITSKILLYNASTALYNDTLPKLPKRLMNGFGFRIKDSIYYGGGYTTNWKDSSLTLDTLFDCSFPTPDTGYVACPNGLIKFTSNSGATWNPKLLNDISKNVVGISFPTSKIGYVITLREDTTASVYSTTNAGNNWNSLTSGAGLNDIYFKNSDTGTVCGNNGSIKSTFNGGANWITQNFGSDNYKCVYLLPNSSTLFICGANGKIIKSTNGGTSWVTQTSNTTKTLNSIIFQGSTGYAVGDSGTILNTLNGGTTWTIQLSHTILNLRSIDKIDANKIIAAGDRGLIIYTTNGGTEWLQRVGVSSNRLNRICIAPGDSIPKAVGVKGWYTKANKPFFEYIINDAFYKINVKSLTSGWDTKASLPIPIAEVFSSSVVINNKIAFVMGGRSTGFNIVNNVMRYNPAVNSWSMGTNLPSPLTSSSAALIDRDKIMIAGGERSDSISNKVYIGTVDSTNAAGYIISWATSTTSFPIRSYAMGSKGFPSKKIAFFIGGNTTQFSFLDGPSGPSSKVFMYTSATDQFTEIQTDIANPICHTGVDGFIGTIPLTSSVSDTSVRIFAPGGRDSNYVSVNRHKVLKINGLVSVQQLSSEIPFRYKLEQNYPNPFNPVTKIRYELPKQSLVEFKVFDILGKEVAIYVNKLQSEGVYEITFDGKSLASGVYLYQLKTNGFTDIRKMLLLK